MGGAYLDGLSRKKTGRIVGRGTVMTTAPSSRYPSSIICFNCDKAEQYRIGCAVPAKSYGESIKPAEQKKAGSGGGAGVLWCDKLETTTHGDAEYLHT